jgi:colicin import membrane protein
VKSFQFGPEPLIQAGEFRRLFLGSLLLHAGVALLLAFSPSNWFAPRPSPVFVELIAALPEQAAAAPQPKAAPEPAPAPEPRQVVDEGVVIPKDPPKPKPKPEPVPEAKPEPPKPKPVAKPEPPKPQLTKEQILAQLRSKVGPVTPEATAVQGASSRGSQRVDPLLAAWHSEVKNLMYANWVGARPFRHRNGLEVQFVLDLDGAGLVRNVRLMRTSGLRVLDESAERTIHKVLPHLPPAPDGLRSVNVTFDPRDV